MKIGDIAIIKDTHPIRIIRGESVVIRDIQLDSKLQARVKCELFYPVKTKYGQEFDPVFWLPARFLEIGAIANEDMG